jgi:hypothetical protein
VHPYVERCPRQQAAAVASPKRSHQRREIRRGGQHAAGDRRHRAVFGAELLLIPPPKLSRRDALLLPAHRAAEDAEFIAVVLALVGVLAHHLRLHRLDRGQHALGCTAEVAAVTRAARDPPQDQRLGHPPPRQLDRASPTDRTRDRGEHLHGDQRRIAFIRRRRLDHDGAQRLGQRFDGERRRRRVGIVRVVLLGRGLWPWIAEGVHR